ncbi:laccase [Ceratobasidium sp. 414]|nr:laccase [Ceratobasidium sp. 414]
MLSSALLACCILSRSSLAAIVPYNFNIRNVNAAPDGFQRSVVSVNGDHAFSFLLPPPPQARKGDTLVVNVTNGLTDATMRRATTIHWHGLFQTGTASEDGPAFVTQCPISHKLGPSGKYLQGHSLGAELRISMFPRYHSHLSSQYVDGLRGALVIYDPQDPQQNLYDVDDASTVITLEDWYHTPAPTLQAQFFSTSNTALAAPVPDSALINGKGRYVGGPTVPRAVIDVTPGKRYRFRVINVSAIGSFTFSIEGHRLTIIEADGIAHHPLVVDSLDLYAGQRYSVILEANQTVANYWVRAPMTVANAANNANLDATNVFAVLRYAGAPNAEPTTEPGTAIGTPLVEENLHALINPGAPGGSGPADVVVNLTIGRTTINGLPAFTFNNIQYQSPTLPTLLKILANNASTDADFATAEHTLTLPFNKVIEINITGGANHPIHLQYALSIISPKFPLTPLIATADTPSTSYNLLADRVINYVNPPRRDVVRVSTTGVVLRFRTDNPGPWFVHCHIDWHLEAGLAVVFAEAPDQTRTGPQRVQPAPGWDQLCPKYAALPAELQ